MNRQQLEKNIYKYASELLTEKGYVSPIDVLMKMEKLSKKQAEGWHFKRIPYLEKCGYPMPKKRYPALRNSQTMREKQSNYRWIENDAAYGLYT
ncbi:hypothetical protein [Oceanobacillus sp. FSL K6-0251]|uniref:hypothetical protein n=1 Tax=Oceanobacillus sp. FSL K6-0251 TaxID=2921602 RepID=UPI0030FB7383